MNRRNSRVRNNSGMSRGRFLRTAGLGAASVGATVMGMSGVASAAAYNEGPKTINVGESWPMLKHVL